MPHVTDRAGKKVWYDIQGNGEPLALIGGSSLVHRAIVVDLTDDVPRIKAPQSIMVGETGPLGKDSDYASGSRNMDQFGSNAEAITIPDTNGTFHVLTRAFECAQSVVGFLKQHRKAQ